MTSAEILQRFEALPLDMELEVGSVVLTIQQIFDLKEGMVLRTGHPSGAPFTLRAGGAAVAAVEVVVVDKSVSVRVKNLFEKPKTMTDSNGTD